MQPERPAEPWFSFLADLDVALTSPVDLHCIGGFVVSQCHGLGRETADLDILTAIPLETAHEIRRIAGQGSALHQKHRVYIDPVGVTNYPCDYAERLIRIFPLWANVQLWALEAHDLALTKLERSNDRDIRDAMYLAEAGYIDREILVRRFETEFEPYVTGRTPTWNRTTLQMWIDSCWPS